MFFLYGLGGNGKSTFITTMRRLTDGESPMLFTSPDYELVVMPMLTSESQKPEDKAETTEPEQAEAEPTKVTEPEAETTEVEEAEKAEAVAEAEAITKTEKPKRKRSKAKEPVAVA